MVKQTLTLRNGFGRRTTSATARTARESAAFRAARGPASLPGRIGRVSLVLAITLAACSPQAVPPETETGEPVHTWSEPLLREHLRFFNSSDAEGRRTGSAGYARSAAYVAARMKQFRLQPGLFNDYRVTFQTPLNTPVHAVLAPQTDTLQYIAGLDFLPDARTDSGTVLFRRVIVVPAELLPPQGSSVATRVLVTAAEGATPEFLGAAAALRYKAVLVVGRLHPGSAARPIPGLAVMQVAEEAASRILGPAVISALSGEAVHGPLELPSEVNLRVTNDYQEEARAVNVMGYLAGKTPGLREEVVLVCSDLDAISNLGGVQALDLQHIGSATSALLEVARDFGLSAHFEPVPQRTLLFAVFSGARVNDAGLRAYLAAPLWPLGQTVAVVYVGLRASREEGIRKLLDPFGIRLIAIQPSGHALPEEDVLLLQRVAHRRIAETRGQGAAPTSRISEIIDGAVLRARSYAEETREIVFRLSSGLL